MNDRRGLLVVGVILALLLAPAGFAIAADLTHSSTAGVVYETTSGVTVTLGDDQEVAANPFADDSTFEHETVTISGSDAAVEFDDQTLTDEATLVVSDVDVTGSLTVEQSNVAQDLVVEDGDAMQIQLEDYAVDNDENDLAYASDGGLTMTFDGLAADTQIAAVDTATDEVLDDANTRGDGAVTLDLGAGTRTVELQTVPAELEVRNEANPDELIQEDAELRARFFGEDDTVIERTVTDGTVSLDGLPADEEIVVTVKEENADFTYRRILIDSIVQTSEIYLLPTTEPSAEVRFQLNDQSGRFDADDTRLFVEKPITRDGTTEYRTISGDRIGADGEFPTILIDSERYRLVVENDDGEQRVLGAYTVQGAEVAPLTIGEVQFEADADGGPAMQATLRDAPEEAAHNHEARIVYVDSAGDTDSITISIEADDGEALRPTTTETLDGTDDIYVETFPLDTEFNPDEDGAIVTVDTDRGLADSPTLTRPIGDVPDVFVDAPIDPAILELMGFVSIVALTGLLVIVNPALAAMVGAGYAGLLSLLGVVPIPMPAVVLAGLVATLATVGTNRGVFG